MDPISAFALAVNVLSTVEIAAKTGKTLWELYKSTSGFTKETEDLISAMQQLDATLVELSAPTLELNASTKTAAHKCSQAIKEIRIIIDRCQVQKQSSALSSFKAKVKTTKQKTKLQDLQNQLEKWTAQLRIALAIATKSDITRMKQLLEASEVHLRDFIPKLDTINQELTKLDENTGLLRMLKDVLCVSEASLEAMNQVAILRALQPATADMRFEDVKDPASDTFRWILDPDEVYSTSEFILL